MIDENLQNASLPDAGKPNEEIVDIIRVHPTILAKPIAKISAIIIVAIGLFLILGITPLTRIIMYVVIAVILFLTTKLYYTYNNSIYILTNKRIINVEQHGFLHRVVTEATLDRILHTAFEVKGFFQTLFNYGTVILKVAGAKDGMILEGVADPYNIQQQITKTVKEFNNPPVKKEEKEPIKEKITLR